MASSASPMKAGDDGRDNQQQDHEIGELRDQHTKLAPTRGLVDPIGSVARLTCHHLGRGESMN